MINDKLKFLEKECLFLHEEAVSFLKVNDFIDSLKDLNDNEFTSLITRKDTGEELFTPYDCIKLKFPYASKKQKECDLSIYIYDNISGGSGLFLIFIIQYFDFNDNREVIIKKLYKTSELDISYIIKENKKFRGYKIKERDILFYEFNQGPVVIAKISAEMIPQFIGYRLWKTVKKTHEISITE